MTIDYYCWDEVAFGTLLYPKLLRSTPRHAPSIMRGGFRLASLDSEFDVTHLVDNAIMRVVTPTMKAWSKAAVGESDDLSRRGSRPSTLTLCIDDLDGRSLDVGRPLRINDASGNEPFGTGGPRGIRVASGGGPCAFTPMLNDLSTIAAIERSKSPR